MPDAKTERRGQRTAAIKALNALAEEFELDAVPVRPAPQEVVDLYSALCDAVPAERAPELCAARDLWTSNGGGGTFSAVPGHGAEEDAGDGPDGRERVPGHAECRAQSGQAFRLKSKAFMLTFNCLAFVASPQLWQEFHSWVEDRKTAHGITYWSATMEESVHSADAGRVHLHCYFSWHGGGSKGVNHKTLDAWVFRGVKPRVDKNTEGRGPWYWMKAAQHGHFYVHVKKQGTLYSDSNYAPWETGWSPERVWIMTLYRQHKLDHGQFLELSMKLRDGHDRAQALVAAIQADEREHECAREQREARARIQKKALPFKPLPDKIQTWRLQFEVEEERYQFLVLFGPSCTGKSRLARSLFGDSETLVVDVQHAEHPDLRCYQRKVHKAILLDEVQSPRFAVDNKKLLQSHVDGAILGQSPTQKFTYKVWLHRIPLMLTTNNWTYDDYSRADQNWIKTNAVEVFIGEPVWQAAATPPRSPAPSVSSGASGRRWVSGRRRQAPAGPGSSPEHKRGRDTPS